jgi:hypothetical protein
VAAERHPGEGRQPGHHHPEGEVRVSVYDVVVDADSPLLWWKLADPVSSAAAGDSSGAGHGGTATAVTFGAAGPIAADATETAASFNGTTSTITSTYKPALAAVTVEAWVNNLGNAASGSPRLAADSHTDADNNGFQLMLFTSAGQFFAQVWFGTGAANANVASAVALPATGWVHLAATWDGTTVRLCQNGVQVASQAFSGAMSAGSAAGTGAGFNPTYNGDFFKGAIGQVAIYGTALSPTRVSVHHWAGLTSAFPQGPLGVTAELFGNGWTDITPQVLEPGNPLPPAVTITRGRPDETSQATAAAAAFRVDNTAGQFTARNPVGPYYPYLGRNAPIRWSVPAAAPFLRLENDSVSYISAPDTAGLSITGDTEIQIDIQPTSYVAATLASKWAVASNQRSWWLGLNADGTVSFSWSANGTAVLSATSTQPLPGPLGRIAIKVTLAVATGTVTFWSAPSIGGSWTQLGSTIVAGATSVFDSTAPVTIGYNADQAALTGVLGVLGAAAGVAWAPAAWTGLNGAVNELRLLSGIGGTLKANPVFTTAPAGAASLTDAQANVWTLVGTAELSARDYRFHGELSALPTEWDPTGHDVWSPITASGLLRRLSQGSQPPVTSPMTRGWQQVTGIYAPVAYYPCEDSAGATQIASGLPGGPPMSVQGTATFGSNSSFAGSGPIPAFSKSRWAVNIPAYTNPGAAPANVVRFLLVVPSGGDTDTGTILRFYTSGTVHHVELQYGVSSSGSLQVVGYDSNDTQLFASGFINFSAVAKGLTGNPAYVEVALTKNGTGVDWHCNVLFPGDSVQHGLSATQASATIGTVSRVVFDVHSNMTSAAGQWSLQSSYDPLGLASGVVAGPFQAWLGETAALRFARICAEQGEPARVFGYPAASMPMGTQAIDSFINLLQSCEDADRGLLGEPRQSLALGYRTLAAMVNQTPDLALDYSADQVSPPLSPIDDDQHTVNDVTVSNVDGSSARVTLADGTAMSTGSPPNGVGSYANSYSVSIGNDAMLGDVAGWILHVGTVNEERYPSIAVDLADSALAGIAAAARAADVGDYLAVTNPPAFLPPGTIKQIVYGATETLGDFAEQIAWNTVPESPYEVAVVATGSAAADYHIDTDGSSLHAGITSGATSMQVDSGAGVTLWTTTAGDFPFDVMMGGEQITVTNITGASSPQTFTITRSVNGVVKAHTAGEDIRLAFPAILALT